MLSISRIGAVGRTYRHVQRYREILRIFIKYGFEDLLKLVRVDEILESAQHMITRGRDEKVESLSRPERFRKALEELGPTFIKMGQMLSTRPDVLPCEFIDELCKLQDMVPPFASDLARKIIEEDLGSPIQEIFSEFQDKPLASASLGQVHEARLRSGERVAVKVQRPEIKRMVQVDLEITLHLATLAERHVEGIETFSPTGIVKEIIRSLERELDYTIEASSIEHFAWQFEDDSTVRVYPVYRDLTTARVLTMGYVEGIKASDVEKLDAEGLNRKEIVQRGFDLLMKQVFVHGFFHADPHPGNVFVLPDNVICFMDFGQMGRLDSHTRQYLGDLLLGVAERDEGRLCEALLKLTEWDVRPSEVAFRQDVLHFMDQNVYRPLKYIELGKMLRDAVSVAGRHRLRMPSGLTLMIKALATMEGLGRVLAPEFVAVDAAAAFMRKWALGRYHPKRLISNFLRSTEEALKILRGLPVETRELIEHTRRGDLRIHFKTEGAESVGHALDRVSNRLAFAIVVASLVIGSALMVHSGVPPRWNDIPVVGLVGFTLAGVLGFWLLLSILRQGRGRM